MTNDRRHECTRSSDFENIAEHQGYVRGKLEGIDSHVKAISAKLETLSAIKKSNGSRLNGNKDKVVYSAITALTIALVYAIIAMVK